RQLLHGTSRIWSAGIYRWWRRRRRRWWRRISARGIRLWRRRRRRRRRRLLRWRIRWRLLRRWGWWRWRRRRRRWAKNANGCVVLSRPKIKDQDHPASRNLIWTCRKRVSSLILTSSCAFVCSQQAVIFSNTALCRC
ncbi:hypothetical protein Tcan_01611, partial [Toxocara canis]